jgi:predicted ATPase
MVTQVFIGREGEQLRLRQFFNQALTVGGQLAFVAGEAGSGKTTLVQIFVAQMQAMRDDLLVAVGDCSTQGGLGDPYLPFREVLAVFTGVETSKAGGGISQNQGRLRQIMVRSIQVLVDVGPDLMGTLAPGAGLLATIGKSVLEKSGVLEELTRLDKRKQEPSTAVEQSRIYEQYANVLKALAKEQPLLIVLDDLHWADEASVGLLFHLYRRLGDSPIFIIGTYRPDEIAVPKHGGRNPLEKVLAEIKRYAGDVTLDLDQTSENDKRNFTNQLLDSEPNHFDATFRQQLFQHTGGHPLFVVELLRTLQERGHLVRDAERRWVASSLNWEALPARVEGVIEERI